MAFPGDRQHWKKPRSRITAKDYDAIIAAIRTAPDRLEEIAQRFDVGAEVVRRLKPKAR
jgi:hypothetical protein